jgi:hypothetical protein
VGYYEADYIQSKIRSIVKPHTEEHTISIAWEHRKAGCLPQIATPTLQRIFELGWRQWENKTNDVDFKAAPMNATDSMQSRVYHW